mgnify:CR=1 FL=1
MLLHVLVAAVLNFIVGAIWYTPSVFGNVWMKEAGIQKDSMDKKHMTNAMITSFICYLVTAFVLFRFLQMTSRNLTDVVSVVLMVWVGFVAAVRLSHYVYERKSFKLFLLTSLHDLAGLIVMALVFWFWK